MRFFTSGEPIQVANIQNLIQTFGERHREIITTMQQKKKVKLYDTKGVFAEKTEDGERLDNLFKDIESMLKRRNIENVAEAQKFQRDFVNAHHYKIDSKEVLEAIAIIANVIQRDSLPEYGQINRANLGATNDLPTYDMAVNNLAGNTSASSRAISESDNPPSYAAAQSRSNAGGIYR